MTGCAPGETGPPRHELACVSGSWLTVGISSVSGNGAPSGTADAIPIALHRGMGLTARDPSPSPLLHPWKSQQRRLTAPIHASEQSGAECCYARYPAAWCDSRARESLATKSVPVLVRTQQHLHRLWKREVGRLDVGDSPVRKRLLHLVAIRSANQRSTPPRPHQ